VTAYTVAQLDTMHHNTEIVCMLKVVQQIYPCTRLSLWERCVEIEAPAGSDIVRPPNPGFTGVTTVRAILAG